MINNTKKKQDIARFNIDLKTRNEDVILKLAERLLSSGQYDQCYQLLSDIAPALQENKNINAVLSRLYRKWIPRWHFSMLNDQNRVQAFSDAINKLNLKDKTVLDVGTGTGLLSMMAAAHGAKHIYTCEALPPIAEVAKKIIKNNGFESKITIIPKMSHDLKIGCDLQERADVLISETIDCGFVGEGFLTSLLHARANLLKPNAILLPQKFCLQGYLIESRDIFNLNKVESALGFDISDFNKFSSRGYFPVRLNTWQHELRSDPFTLIKIDLDKFNSTKIKNEIHCTATSSGIIHGVAFWFDVNLNDEIKISNHHANRKSHWMQAFACFDKPRAVTKNQKLIIDFILENDSIEILMGC